MSSLNPRIVLVTRETEYQALLAAHGTRGQAEFFLSSRDQNIQGIEARHEDLQSALQKIRACVPADWAIAEVERNDLDRFLFSRDDIVVAVGQDGLVANLAKYVSGQPIVGVAPSTEGSEGILTTIAVEHVEDLLHLLHADQACIEKRTMVEANLGTGETLVALNELFIGHRSHQSAKYLLNCGGKEEFHSSSGIIVSTGTGATGWAKSIMTATNQFIEIAPTDQKAMFFAREPWPSKASGCELKCGFVDEAHPIEIVSRINEGGVIFADGIEQDFLRFDWGRRARICLSQRTLNLVGGA